MTAAPVQKMGFAQHAAQSTPKPTLPPPQSPTSCLCSDALGGPLRTAEICDRSGDWLPVSAFLCRRRPSTQRGEAGKEADEEKIMRRKDLFHDLRSFSVPGVERGFAIPTRARVGQSRRLSGRKEMLPHPPQTRARRRAPRSERTEPPNERAPRLSPSPGGRRPRSLRMTKRTWLAWDRCAAGLSLLQMTSGAGDPVRGMTRKAVRLETCFYPSERGTSDSFHLPHLL